MIYYDNLWNQVIEQVPSGTTEVKILSGYVGPSPIDALHSHPDINYTVVFGLFKENRKKTLHDELVRLHRDNVKVLYPSLPAHSKCYVWLNNGVPIKAMIGSANFSSNGLNIPYRESLLETNDVNTKRINEYVDLIIKTCRECTDIDETELQASTPRFAISTDTEEYEEGVAKLNLLDRGGNLPALSGINWGMSPTSHVNQDDAYIPIRKEVLKNHPELFTPRISLPEGVQARGNIDEVVELIWDDGTIMQVKFEGTQDVTDGIGNSIKYPKQISSFPNKSIMGRYLRNRLGVQSGVVVTKEDLERYGTTCIRLTKLSEGVYSADFSANQENKHIVSFFSKQ